MDIQLIEKKEEARSFDFKSPLHQDSESLFLSRKIENSLINLLSFSNQKQTQYTF